LNPALSTITFLFLVLSSLSGNPALVAAAQDGVADAVSAVLPLGIDVLAQPDQGATFAVYASMEGMSAPPVAARDPVRSDSLSAGRHFPSPLSFRVTATTLTVSTADLPARIETTIDTAELIKTLRFRLRINNGGLQTERIQPVETRMIGVPADVPYGERIYRVTFQMPRLSPNARLVLEVVSPNGELLSKFPVMLN
jgi:hypothetical protein